MNPHLDPKVAHLLKVIAGTIIFHLIDRQSEYIQRVGFMYVFLFNSLTSMKISKRC